MSMVMDAAVVTFGALDHGVEHVGWSVDETGEGDHFIVEGRCGDAADLEDRYCLVVGSATYYAGIISTKVEDGKTLMVLTDEAAAALGVDSELRFRYPPALVDRPGLRAQRARLLSE